jgi:large subunit ribosomal protein L18
MLKKQILRQKRKKSIRKTLSGTVERPRLSVFRSNKNMSAQIIDDTIGKTLVGLSSRTLKTKGTKSTIAAEFGKVFAEEAKKKNITKVVFDRAGFKYHGRVKAFADSAREGGLNF